MFCAVNVGYALSNNQEYSAGYSEAGVAERGFVDTKG